MLDESLCLLGVSGIVKPLRNLPGAEKAPTVEQVAFELLGSIAESLESIASALEVQTCIEAAQFLTSHAKLGERPQLLDEAARALAVASRLATAYTDDTDPEQPDTKTPT